MIPIKPVKLSKLGVRIRWAKSVIGGGKYRLGRGGFDPKSRFPWDKEGLLDCSGFIAWVLEMRRDQVNARKPWSALFPWIETSAIVRDLLGPQRVFVRIAEPVPGCLVVVGDGGGKQGHVGLVVDVFDRDGSKGYTIIDAAASGPDAVAQRTSAWFEARKDRRYFCLLREDFLAEP